MITNSVYAVFSSDEERDRNGKKIGWSVGVSLMLILSVIVFCFWKRRQKQAKAVATRIGKQTSFQKKKKKPIGK